LRYVKFYGQLLYKHGPALTKNKVKNIIEKHFNIPFPSSFEEGGDDDQLFKAIVNKNRVEALPLIFVAAKLDRREKEEDIALEMIRESETSSYALIVSKRRKEKQQKKKKRGGATFSKPKMIKPITKPLPILLFL